MDWHVGHKLQQLRTFDSKLIRDRTLRSSREGGPVESVIPDTFSERLVRGACQGTDRLPYADTSLFPRLKQLIARMKISAPANVIHHPDFGAPLIPSLRPPLILSVLVGFEEDLPRCAGSAGKSRSCGPRSASSLTLILLVIVVC